MFVFFEYTAVLTLTALLVTFLFAVSVALLMVEEGLAADLRMFRRSANTINMRNDGSRFQRRVAEANPHVPLLIMALLRRNEIRRGGYLGTPHQS
jgi:hypothetical protein